MAGSTACNKPEHKMHICALKERGFDKKNPDKFRDMTKNPQEKCTICRARANKSEYLCKPVKI